MKNRPGILITLIALTAYTGSSGPVAREPVIGGPCENCDLVFMGIPVKIDSRSRIAPAGEPGEPLIIVGRVRDAKGRSAPGVIVYAYHTDSFGVYPRSDTQHGRLRGWAKADSAGHYQFITIRPGAYPGGSAPEHVHMHLIEHGRGTYWIGDINFDDDPLLSNHMKEQRSGGRGGNGVCTPTRDSRGVWHVTRDIVLGQGIDGYPDSAHGAAGPDDR